MKDRRLSRIAKVLACYMAVYYIINIPIMSYINIDLFMVWNLFLAVFPLIFAYMFQKQLEKARKVRAAVWGLLWLLFFPNAPYMLTDFAHLSKLVFFTPTLYDVSRDYMIWVTLVHIGIGVFVGTLAGLLSLYIVHQQFFRRFGTVLSWCAVAAVGLLSGLAIYLGRFLRLNSWDVLNPVSLAERIFNDFGLSTLVISLLFSAYVLSTYVFFYFFYHHKES